MHMFNDSVEFDLMTSEYGQELTQWYEIIEPIYRSSNSEIFLASDATGELFTIKAIKRRTDVSFDLTGLSGIQHPRIAGIVCHGVSERFLYVVKPFIEGRNLREAVETDGAFNEERLLSILRQLLSIFEYLHGLNPAVIYRDLKPENLIIDDKDQITLIDIITGRQLNKGKRHDTFHVGTAGFASPEQYGYRQTDERTDIYAIGSTLYYLGTKEIPDMEAMNTFVASDKISGLIHKCMAFNPDDRFQNVTQIIAYLTGKKGWLSYRSLVGISMIAIVAMLGIWQFSGIFGKDTPLLSDNSPTIDIDGIEQVERPQIETDEQTLNSSDEIEIDEQMLESSDEMAKDTGTAFDQEDSTGSDETGDDLDISDEITDTDVMENDSEAAGGIDEHTVSETDILGDESPDDADEDRAEADNVGDIPDQRETDAADDVDASITDEADVTSDIAVSKPVIAYDVENIKSYEDIPIENIPEIGDALNVHQVLESVYFTVDKSLLTLEQQAFTHISVGSTDMPMSDRLLKESIYGAVIMGYGIDYYRELGFGSVAMDTTTNYLVLIFDESYYCVGYAYIEDYTAINYGFADYSLLDPGNPNEIANVIDNGVVLYYNESTLNLEVNQALLTLEDAIAFISVVGIEGPIGEDVVKSIESNRYSYAVPFDHDDNYFNYTSVGYYEDVNYLILLMNADRDVMCRYVTINIQ